MKNIQVIDACLTKEDILKSLATGLQQLSLDGKNGETYVAEARQTKNGVNIECVDGTKFSLTLTSLG